MGILSYLHLYPQRLFEDGERQSQSVNRSITLNPQAARETGRDEQWEKHGCVTIRGLNSYCYWRPAKSPNHSPRKICPCLLSWANQSLLVSAVQNTNIRRPYKGSSRRPFPWRRERSEMLHAQGVILNQKFEVQNIISHFASHVHPQTEMLCLMSLTKSSSCCWVKNVFCKEPNSRAGFLEHSGSVCWVSVKLILGF